MSVKGEIFITANGSEIEGPRDNYSSLIFEFNHKIYLPYENVSHQAQGTRQLSAFSIVKDIDQMTPQLYKSVDKGEVCEILIKLYRIAKDTGQEEEYFNYTLKNARIASVENWMPSTKIEANEDIGHLEKVEMVSEIFTVKYLEGGIEYEIKSYVEH